jgi:sec-independent protein translocase protein TatA
MHLLLIVIIALIIFGPQRLPELGKSLGKSITEFKQATKDITDPINQVKAELTGQKADPTTPAAQDKQA